MKRLHPRFRDEDDEGDDDVNGKLVYQSDAPDDDATDEPNEAIDPRWEALRKLNNN